MTLHSLLNWDHPYIRATGKKWTVGIPLSNHPLLHLMAWKAKTQVNSDPSEATLAFPAPKRRGRVKQVTKKALATRVAACSTPQSRSAHVPTMHEDKDGERIDIDRELTEQSTESDDSVSDDIPRARSGRPSNNSQPAQTEVYNPIIDMSQTQSMKTASTVDIQYFFEHTSENSICRPCRSIPFILDLLSKTHLTFPGTSMMPTRLLGRKSISCSVNTSTHAHLGCPPSEPTLTDAIFMSTWNLWNCAVGQYGLTVSRKLCLLATPSLKCAKQWLRVGRSMVSMHEHL